MGDQPIPPRASGARRPSRAGGVRDQSRMAAIRHEARGAAREPDGGTPGRAHVQRLCGAEREIGWTRMTGKYLSWTKLRPKAIRLPVDPFELLRWGPAARRPRNMVSSSAL